MSRDVISFALNPSTGPEVQQELYFEATWIVPNVVEHSLKPIIDVI
jgi:hypothetical protein